MRLYSTAILIAALAYFVPVIASLPPVAQRDSRTDDEIWGELEQSAATLTRRYNPRGRGGTHIADPWGAESSEKWHARTAALPLCRVGCAAAVNGSVLLPPLSSRGRRWGGDKRGAYDWTCWIAHLSYHTPPGCYAQLGLGSVGPESLSWTTHDALRERCRLPDWSPAGAARAWRERREAARGNAAAVARPVTVLLWGSSLTRGTFEALVCRWNDEISGGFLNIDRRDGDGSGEQPLAATRAGGGSCHGTTLGINQTWAELWEKIYPSATHGGAQFSQDSKMCNDNWACVEFGGGEESEGGGQPVLRLCYAFYGLKSRINANSWAFCNAGLRLDEVDVLISEQGDDAYAASLAKLQTPSFASCRGNGPLTFVTLRLGTVVGLRPVVDELARGSLAQVRVVTGRHPYVTPSHYRYTSLAQARVVTRRHPYRTPSFYRYASLAPARVVTRRHPYGTP